MKQKVAIQIFISVDMLDDIHSLTTTTGRSRSDVCRTLLQHALDNPPSVFKSDEQGEEAHAE